MKRISLAQATQELGKRGIAVVKLRNGSYNLMNKDHIVATRLTGFDVVRYGKGFMKGVK